MGEGELSISHFRNTVTSETEKLTAFCNIWRQCLKNDKNLSEEIQGDINVAVGQAELLMKERFGQFSRLIDQSENKTGEKEITCQDLDGFWFMVYPQVKDVYQKFNNLETLKKNKWVEPDVISAPPKPTVLKVNRKPVALPAKPKPLVSGKSSSSSNIRAHILAAKMKMKAQQEKAQQEKEQIIQDSATITTKNSDEKISAKIVDENKTPTFKITPDQENKKTAVITPSRSETGKKSSNKISPTNRSKIPVRKVSPANKENCNPPSSNKVTSKKVTITLKSTPKTLPIPQDMRKSLSPECNTFDAGFFKVQTPAKKAAIKKISAPLSATVENKETSTKSTGARMQRILSSSVLKERFRNVPMEHKDYSSCMRITRSMKKNEDVRKLDF